MNFIPTTRRARSLSASRGALDSGHDAIMAGTEDFSQGWTLDGEGNWTGFQEDDTGSGTPNLIQTRPVNDANQITSISNASPAPAWVTPVYDAGGNMTTTPEPGNEGTAVGCVYDAWNRLVSATVGGTTVNYAYDGQGRMIDRTQGDVTTHYYYVGQQVIETRAGLSSAAPQSLEPQYQYVWSPIDIDAPILRDVYNSSGEVVSTGRIYYLTDANDNVTGATNASGVVQERYLYDAYGKVTICSANWIPTGQASSVGNTLLYTGQQQDPTTGLFCYHTRWYNPSAGTFTSTDRGGSDLNLYRYTESNPLNATDPTGEQIALGSGGVVTTIEEDYALHVIRPSRGVFDSNAIIDIAASLQGDTRNGRTFLSPPTASTSCKVPLLQSDQWSFTTQNLGTTNPIAPVPPGVQFATVAFRIYVQEYFWQFGNPGSELFPLPVPSRVGIVSVTLQIAANYTGACVHAETFTPDYGPWIISVTTNTLII